MKRTMDEYKEWLGQDTVDQETQDSFNRALEVLENVQFLEDKLVRHFRILNTHYICRKLIWPLILTKYTRIKQIHYISLKS